MVTVVATGRPADTMRLRELGAATVLDRAAGPLAEQVLALYPDGVDALINLAGNSIDDVPLAAVTENGTVATTTTAPDADTLAAAGLTGGGVQAMPVRELLAPLAEQAAAGILRIDVRQVLPFEQALDGLATIASGAARGKLVVTLQD